MNIEQELHKHLFQQREEQTQHLEYNLEFQFYNAVASGDMETVSRYCTAEQDETVYDGTEYGRLSENRLQNARYHFVVAVADRKSTRLNSSHPLSSRMPSSA